MHLGAVAVIGLLVGLSGSKMKRTGDFLIKQNVPHRFSDMRVKSKGKLTDIARTLVGVENAIKRPGIVSFRLDDFPFFEFQLHVVE